MYAAGEVLHILLMMGAKLIMFILSVDAMLRDTLRMSWLEAE